jgi:hypothetical protein
MEEWPRSVPWKLLMEQCASSAGIFTCSEAAALGFDVRRLSRLESRGTLVRETRGVYRLTAYPLGLDQKVVIATRTGGVVSHETAARLWGFDGFEGSSVIHVTVRHGLRVAGPKWVSVHVTRRSLESLTTTRRSVPVTRPMRTVLDLADRPVEDERYRGFVNHCIAGRLFTLPSLERFAAARGARMSGIVRLRRMLTDLGDVDSIAEAQLIDLLVASGIERPATQFEIRDGRRFVARVDLAWPARRVALELDGYRYHADALSFVSDRERGNRIVALGWALLRTTPTALRQRPHMVIDDVKTALRLAGVA